MQDLLSLNLPDATPLAECRAWLCAQPTLTDAEREDIVDQAIALLEGLYVHTESKWALYGVDPVHRLRRLRRRLEPSNRAGLDAPAMTDGEFHREMLATFASLGDLHTSYVLPEPYQRRVAFLPFLIERCQDGRHLVTQVRPEYSGDRFARGVEVTHYNGVPIERAAELQGDRSAGGNHAARQAKGLARLTCRYLALEYLPDEEWVDIGFIADGQEHEKCFEWIAGQVPGERSRRTGLREPPGRGLDAGAEMHRKIRVRHVVKPAGRPDDPLADVLVWRLERRDERDYGYLRIYSFDVPSVSPFIEQVKAHLDATPDENGLIVDVRGNPGGDIAAAEQLLQLLTGRFIEPQRFQLRASPMAKELAVAAPSLAPWGRQLDAAMATGSFLTHGAPLASPEKYNATGQHYQGPVVIIVDPLSYSATDVFVAGCEDHLIGPILGTGARTGAGGATVVDHDELVEALEAARRGPAPLHTLPGKASFRIALMRGVRVGENAGTPVEDLGVTPTFFHHPTEDDLLCGNVDLITHAVRLLHDQPHRSRLSLKADLQTRAVTVTGSNVAWFELFIGSQILGAFPLGAEPLELQLEEGKLRPGIPLYAVGFKDHVRRVTCRTRVT